jgi:hypothetical protein
MLRIDHLAVVAGRLEEGVAAVEGLLGVPMAGGGKHAPMGTHNRLISLGDLYLEVIAVDPDAPLPGRPRWFDMDSFSGPPRLTNWVAACDDLAAEVAVPPDGRLPFGGAFPALIRWQGTAHPAPALPDHGLRLTRLEIGHPEGEALRAALAGRLDDARVVIRPAAEKTLSAVIATPAGERRLG